MNAKQHACIGAITGARYNVGWAVYGMPYGGNLPNLQIKSIRLLGITHGSLKIIT
jgi:hypothetical protein